MYLSSARLRQQQQGGKEREWQPARGRPTDRVREPLPCHLGDLRGNFRGRYLITIIINICTIITCRFVIIFQLIKSLNYVDVKITFVDNKLLKLSLLLLLQLLLQLLLLLLLLADLVKPIMHWLIEIISGPIFFFLEPSKHRLPRTYLVS